MQTLMQTLMATLALTRTHMQTHAQTPTQQEMQFLCVSACGCVYMYARLGCVRVSNLECVYDLEFVCAHAHTHVHAYYVSSYA